jgi:hypothetical protein
MRIFVASAVRTDLSGSQWFIILTGVAILAVVAVLTAIPIGLARRRSAGRSEGVTVAAVFWGVASAGSVLWYYLAKLRWADEYQRLVESGYYDPRDLSGQPAWPWPLWLLLAVVFCALLAWSFRRKSSS